MGPPVLLVDVDGVLNVYGVDGCPDGYAEFVLFPEDDEPARLCPAHGSWLRELAEGFELAWATGWGSEANRALAPILGLDPLPVVEMPAIPFAPAEKVPAVAAYVADRPAAWLDDLVTPEARAWASARTAPTLLVDVDHRTGLQRHHVEDLLAWATQHGPR